MPCDNFWDKLCDSRKPFFVQNLNALIRYPSKLTTWFVLLNPNNLHSFNFKNNNQRKVLKVFFLSEKVFLDNVEQ